MAKRILRQVVRLVGGGAGAPAEGDHGLLERFVADGDGAAFALLVRRHGPMVLGVCRRVLRDDHLAEDAFQATFLVLARKARSVGRPGALPCWLARVAVRIALRARQQEDPLRRAGRTVERLPIPEPAAGGADVGPALAEEVARLPGKYRDPVVLCYWQGKTYEEAAAELGCPGGTVAGRLARAREMLRRRLARRGLGSAGAAPLAGGPAHLPDPLADATVRSALALAAGHLEGASPGAIALVRGMERTMLLTRLSVVAALLVALAASAAAGFALLAAPQPAGEQPARSRRGAAADVEAKAVAKFNHNGYVYSAFFSPDGKYLITAGGDFDPDISTGQAMNGRIRLWKLDTGKEAYGPPPARFTTQAAALSPDGNWLVYSTCGYRLGPLNRPAVAQPGELTVLDVRAGKVKAELKTDSFSFDCLTFSRDGKTLAAASGPFNARGLPAAPGGVIRLFDTSSWKERAALVGHHGYVRSVALAPDARTLVSASYRPAASPRDEERDGELKLWDLKTGKERASLAGHKGGVWAVAFSPDGKKVASGGKDGTVRLWDAKTGKLIAALAGHKGAVLALAFSPDGKWLASGGGDPATVPAPAELKLWDVARRKEKQSLPGHDETVFAVAFDREGKRLVSGDTKGTVKVWALAGKMP
jgi:RNA polymerase sigma factor (sigma-70 family)